MRQKQSVSTKISYQAYDPLEFSDYVFVEINYFAPICTPQTLASTYEIIVAGTMTLVDERFSLPPILRPFSP